MATLQFEDIFEDCPRITELKKTLRDQIIFLAKSFDFYIKKRMDGYSVPDLCAVHYELVYQIHRKQTLQLYVTELTASADKVVDVLDDSYQIRPFSDTYANKVVITEVFDGVIDKEIADDGIKPLSVPLPDLYGVGGQVNIGAGKIVVGDWFIVNFDNKLFRKMRTMILATAYKYAVRVKVLLRNYSLCQLCEIYYKLIKSLQARLINEIQAEECLSAGKKLLSDTSLVNNDNCLAPSSSFKNSTARFGAGVATAPSKTHNLRMRSPKSIDVDIAKTKVAEFLSDDFLVGEQYAKILESLKQGQKLIEQKDKANKKRKVRFATDLVSVKEIEAYESSSVEFDKDNVVGNEKFDPDSFSFDDMEYLHNQIGYEFGTCNGLTWQCSSGCPVMQHFIWQYDAYDMLANKGKASTFKVNSKSPVVTDSGISTVISPYRYQCVDCTKQFFVSEEAQLCCDDKKRQRTYDNFI